MTTPVYSYQEYIDFIEQNYRRKEIDTKILSKKVIYLITVIILFLGIGKYHPYDLIDTNLFKERSIIYKFIYIYIQGIFIRIRYYIIWLLSEIIIVLINIRDYETNYEDYLSLIDIIKVESTISPRVRVAEWNKLIAKFYRLCFYNTLVNYFKLEKNHASLLVFIISAFWHGFYPTYYISFFFIYLATMTERIVFKNKDKLWFYPHVLMWLAFDIAAISFKRHTLRSTKEVLNNTWVFALVNPIAVSL